MFFLVSLINSLACLSAHIDSLDSLLQMSAEDSLYIRPFQCFQWFLLMGTLSVSLATIFPLELKVTCNLEVLNDDGHEEVINNEGAAQSRKRSSDR